MKYYLPIHINGGNRGCEAITKATMDILGCTKEQLVVYSSNIEIDRSLGLEQRVTLVARKQFSFLFKVIRKIRNVLLKNNIVEISSHITIYITLFTEDYQT